MNSTSSDVRMAEARPIDSGAGDQSADLLCLSHLRWRFVLQRPQHLLSRCARDRRVFYVEEPVHTDGPARLELIDDSSGVRIVVPHIPADADVVSEQRRLLEQLTREQRIERPVLWYYTPMAVAFSRWLPARAVVFDCMDELSAFAHAPAELPALEAELLARADLVFTGGRSLFEAKRSRHSRVSLFPSSVDQAHFARARQHLEEAADQVALSHPRLGFFGVLDERLDLELLDGVASRRPDWQLVMVGPVVKIDPATLPKHSNVHYLGSRDYAQLPSYLVGWEVAMLPFARNASTRFISPTKTPEYLAAGRPVVSTSVRDVVTPYGELGLVRIADTPDQFVAQAEMAMREDDAGWLARVDAELAGQSWDRTWSEMRTLIDEVAAQPERGRGVSSTAQPAEALTASSSR